MIDYKAEYNKWNPQLATGDQLDAIGDLVGFKRIKGRFWPESDKDYRVRILKELKRIRDNHELIITRQESVADNFGEHF